MDERIAKDQRHPTTYWHRQDDGRIQCDVCPHDCKLSEGQRGLCFVRACADQRIVLTTYGRAAGFCVEPIEKKRLNHFYPGSNVYSLGTAGCNLTCKFCRNWDISTARDRDRIMNRATPAAIAWAARLQGNRSVVFADNDPVVFLEYALDAAEACHDRGLKTVAMTAGFINAEPRREFFAKMDAANIDLKGFSDRFYRKLCGAHLQPVLDTLVHVYYDTDCWLEITTLLIPGQNDSDLELDELSKWICKELGPEVPLHFSAFHPDWKLTDIPPTPGATLRRARRIALDAGLQYVYTGNGHDAEGGTTYCPVCQRSLIVRDGHQLQKYVLTSSGCCPHCQTRIAGHFASACKPAVAQPHKSYIQLTP